MAEGVGFEPTEPVSGLSGFQDRRIRPLCHPSFCLWKAKQGPEEIPAKKSG